MAHLKDLPSLRKQHLISEFTGLKQACPQGVFLSLTPGDPTLWSAVLFVREGPYAPAVLRFQLSFPDTYPKLPPLILFSTDVFHPLITPLTTYMYTTDAQIDGTVSASDQERLPPGGFSLRHGFPGWFGRGTRTESGDRRVSGERTVSSGSSAPPEHSLMSSGPSHASSAGDNGTDKLSLSIYSVLKYIRSAFDTPEVLDAVPLAAAGNPGAWHAWRTHRRKQGKLADQAQHSSENAETDGVNSGPSESTAEPAQPPNTAIRRPGEWNWDGVWEDRVKKGVAASLSEAVLYGSSGAPDEMIHFIAMGETDVESVKENLRRTLGNSV